jgi:hypothetical protein
MNTRFLPLLSNFAQAALLCLLLGACANTKSTRAYQTESFTSETPFQYYSNREPDVACEVAKRALLSQGYQVDDAKPRNIRGEKFFRPQPDQATTLSITLVCLPSSLGAVVYANGLETQYEMKSKGASAGVSVATVGSVSLPWAMDKDTLVKIGEETITAPEFYQRLFDLFKMLDN